VPAKFLIEMVHFMGPLIGDYFGGGGFAAEQTRELIEKAEREICNAKTPVYLRVSAHSFFSDHWI
jgi:hypothetical protein